MRKDSSRKGGEGTNRNGRKACKTKVTCREEEKWARDNSNVKADEKQEKAKTLELGRRPTKKLKGERKGRNHRRREGEKGGLGGRKRKQSSWKGSKSVKRWRHLIRFPALACTHCWCRATPTLAKQPLPTGQQRQVCRQEARLSRRPLLQYHGGVCAARSRQQSR